MTRALACQLDCTGQRGVRCLSQGLLRALPGFLKQPRPLSRKPEVPSRSRVKNTQAGLTLHAGAATATRAVLSLAVCRFTFLVLLFKTASKVE